MNAIRNMQKHKFVTDRSILNAVFAHNKNAERERDQRFWNIVHESGMVLSVLFFFGTLLFSVLWGLEFSTAFWADNFIMEFGVTALILTPLTAVCYGFAWRANRRLNLLNQEEHDEINDATAKIKNNDWPDIVIDGMSKAELERLSADEIDELEGLITRSGHVLIASAWQEWMREGSILRVRDGAVVRAALNEAARGAQESIELNQTPASDFVLARNNTLIKDHA